MHRGSALTPTAEQGQSVLDALLEDLIGEPLVGQGPGDLERPDHQGEDAECLHARWKLWDTPNVAHDNPTDQRFHASLILGFTDTDAMRVFFGSGEIASLSGRLPEFVSAVHAYEVTEALAYVKDGIVLPDYQK